MADKPFPASALPAIPATPAPSETKPATGGETGSAPRHMGHRSSDMRDAMAEMAERAQVISQEAGTKIAAAMKDVITAAAGIAGFAVESARDLVQYMVRRGQMTQDEADKLIRAAEEAQGRRGGSDRGRVSALKPGVDRPTSKSEAPRDAVKHEAPKAAPSSATKRVTSASASAKPEKKSSAKRAASPKKPSAKPATAKKRR